MSSVHRESLLVASDPDSVAESETIFRCPRHNSKPHIAVRPRLLRDISDARQLATADGARISPHSVTRIDSAPSDAHRSDRANDVSQQCPPKGQALGAGTGRPSNSLAYGYRSKEQPVGVDREFCGISVYYLRYVKNCNLPTPRDEPNTTNGPISDPIGQRGVQRASHRHL